MDWSKYLAIPTTEYRTAKEIGMAPATLMAMGKRKLVEVQDTTPKRYRRINSTAAKIYYLCEKYAEQYDTYFGLHSEGEKYGMLCSIINNTVCNCWNKPIDVEQYTIIRLGRKYYSLKTGKEII